MSTPTVCHILDARPSALVKGYTTRTRCGIDPRTATEIAALWPDDDARGKGRLKWCKRCHAAQWPTKPQSRTEALRDVKE
jgi:hypothetical protein